MRGGARRARVGFVGQDDVGGLGLSISRTICSLLWLDDADADAQSTAARARAAYNAAVFGLSMSFERAALVFGGAVVPALTGRNFFFPNKPDSFHATCANYARASTALALAVAAVAGPGALTWLFWAEVGWQLPIHPASAMFVSNHPSLESPIDDVGCQPTASVYLSSGDGHWYDWLCFSNYHTEHHDYDVPAFRLRKLRDLAPEHSPTTRSPARATTGGRRCAARLRGATFMRAAARGRRGRE